MSDSRTREVLEPEEMPGTSLSGGDSQPPESDARRQLRPRRNRKPITDDMVDSDEGDRDDDDDFVDSPPSKRQRVAKRPTSPARRKPQRKSSETPHLENRHPQLDAHPPMRALELVASFVNDLKTLGSLSATCKTLRWRLVHAPDAWKRWQTVLMEYREMPKKKCCQTFALTPAVLENNLRQGVIPSTNQSGSVIFRCPLDVASVFAVALQPRRKQRGLSFGMGELFRARAERSRRNAAANIAARTRRFRENIVNPLRWRLERLQEVLSGDEVERLLPAMVSPLRKRLESVEKKVEEVDADSAAVLDRLKQSLAEAEALKSLLGWVVKAETEAKSPVWDGVPGTEEVATLLSALMEDCRSVSSWEDVKRCEKTAHHHADSIVNKTRDMAYRKHHVMCIDEWFRRRVRTLEAESTKAAIAQVFPAMISTLEEGIENVKATIHRIKASCDVDLGKQHEAFVTQANELPGLAKSLQEAEENLVSSNWGYFDSAVSSVRVAFASVRSDCHAAETWEAVERLSNRIRGSGETVRSLRLRLMEAGRNATSSVWDGVPGAEEMQTLLSTLVAECRSVSSWEDVKRCGETAYQHAVITVNKTRDMEHWKCCAEETVERLQNDISIVESTKATVTEVFPALISTVEEGIENVKANLQLPEAWYDVDLGKQPDAFVSRAKTLQFLVKLLGEADANLKRPIWKGANGSLTQLQTELASLRADCRVAETWEAVEALSTRIRDTVDLISRRTDERRSEVLGVVGRSLNEVLERVTEEDAALTEQQRWEKIHNALGDAGVEPYSQNLLQGYSRWKFYPKGPLCWMQVVAMVEALGGLKRAGKERRVRRSMKALLVDRLYDRAIDWYGEHGSPWVPTEADVYSELRSCAQAEIRDGCHVRPTRARVACL